jgi:hypothetical protein
MRTIGRLTTLVILAVGAVAAAVGVKSIPDLQRYLKIRQM